tara:strand:- start:782 stop:1120 length:339 start_codon:yes stop_codon:yes gene_type:complete
MIVQIELSEDNPKVPHDDLAIIHMDHDPPKIPSSWEEFDGPYTDLKDMLGGIRGLESFQSESYKIILKKGRVFEWDEVMPRTVNALCEFFNDYDIEIDHYAHLIFDEEGQAV